MLKVRHMLETHDLLDGACEVAAAAGLNSSQMTDLLNLPVRLCSRRVARGDFHWSLNSGAPLEIRLSSNYGGLRNLHTFAHELAHAIDCVLRGTTDHGPEWCAIAGLLGVDISAYTGKAAA